MNRLEKDIVQTNNKITGCVKEATDRFTGNENLKLLGSLQSVKELAEWGSTPLKRCIMRQLITERMNNL